MKTISILLLTVCIYSCNVSKPITGKITSLKDNVVTVDKSRQFKVNDTTGLYLGKVVSFTPTLNRNKVNSKKIN